MSQKFRNRFRIDSTRLKGFDYSRNGMYFITICTNHRKNLFGRIVYESIHNKQIIPVLNNDNIHMDYDVETGLRPVSTLSTQPTSSPSPSPSPPSSPPPPPPPIIPKIVLSGKGEIVSACWYDLPNHYSNIILDEFIVMPNHVHGIIIIKNNNDEKTKHGIPEFIRAFKSFSSRRINQLYVVETGLRPVSTTTPKSGIWQSRYYDHIIRDVDDLNRIRLYIINNPINLRKDKNNHKHFPDQTS